MDSALRAKQNTHSHFTNQISPSSQSVWCFACIIFAISLLSACSDVITATPHSSPSDEWFSVYFSDPTSEDADSYRNGPDGYLAAAVDGARVSVDVAIYSFSLWSLRNALFDALQRGVRVRLVAETDYLDRVEI